MSRYDLRWIRRHPLQWVRICWWHWTIAAVLAVKAVVVTDATWTVVPGATGWPVVFGFASAAAALSAIAPLERRLQDATAAILFGIATSRAVSYLALWAVGDIDATAVVLAQAFALHWIIVALVALRWPVLSTAAGAHLAVAAAQDDRGTG